MLNNSPTALDAIDRRLILALRKHPRSSLTSLAKQTDVARGTVYSRLNQLESRGVINGYGPEIDPTAAGYSVLGFCTLEIQQGSHDETTKALSELPEVLEIHTITGDGDLLLRVIARSNDHLHDVLQAVSAIPTVVRTKTQLALATTVSRPATHVLAEINL
jgi:DNA-binding Lrp family transcriptional regulator